jgi:cephalosporin hydroxylase
MNLKEDIVNKKIVTREEFKDELSEHAKKMAADTELQRDALDVLARADHHKWVHQTTWLGEPILNIPHDMLALQEIIYRTRPDYIIEVGVAWGGALLFYSTLMEVLGGKKIVGIDIFVPDDLEERIGSYGTLSERIEWVVGSSIEEETVRKVQEIIGPSKSTMIFLDSNHTHQHVLKELEIYSRFVGKGCYLICGDTIVEDIPEQKHRPREWGPGNSPKTALKEFLATNDRFEVDKALENKLLFTCNPGGYLQAVKDLK